MADNREPQFIREMTMLYQARAAHVFILHGNIEDHVSNDGSRHMLSNTLELKYDVATQLLAAGEDTAVRAALLKQGDHRYLVTYNVASGLGWSDMPAENAFKAAYRTICDALSRNKIGSLDSDAFDMTGSDPDRCLEAMNQLFQATKYASRLNQEAEGFVELPKMQVVLLIQDADAVFGFSGEIGEKGQSDRKAVVMLRNWARDEALGNRNRIIMTCRSLGQIHPSIRGGDSRVAGILVSRPSLQDREEWLTNYDARFAANPQKLIKGIIANGLNLAPEFSIHDFAVQSAGLSRVQMDNIVMNSWVHGKQVSAEGISARKKKVLEDEFGGLLDFHDPEHGFSAVGGNKDVIRYFQDRIIRPLLRGDRARCSMGALLVGPPGVGKTFLVKALAYETKLPCLHLTLSRLFGSLVGETESKTERMLEAIEAAAPCIAIVDEIDSALGQGRVSSGDSNTGGRMFNRIMDWLSNESRRGRIVAVGISNRPDLLDDALTRAGRFDAVLPVLPPAAGQGAERASILKALASKHGIAFHRELEETIQDHSNGLGKLLNSNDIWTGAEIEVLLTEASFKAFARNERVIGLRDWNSAMHWFSPSTRNVQAYIDLALAMTTHMEYCPAAWQTSGMDRNQLEISGRNKLRKSTQLEERTD